MTATGLDVFDTTVHQTNAWLKAIMEELDSEDRHEAYLALRGTLHAVRDYLSVDEGAHLAAQLPLLVRGVYYDAWDPSPPAEERGRDDFLGRIAAAFERSNPAVDPARVARATLRTLNERISAGEAEEVRRLMPAGVRDLWP